MVNPGEWEMLPETRPMRYYVFAVNARFLFPEDGSG